MTNNIKDKIDQFLRSYPGKLLILKSATGALVFNPSDYCPYSDSCLSFQRHARGKNGSKGVQSHLRKVHSDVTYYLIPCSLADFVKYDKDHAGVVTNIMDGIRVGRLKLCPIVSSSAEARNMEKRLHHLFAERRFRDHFDMFLHRSIPSTSKNINGNDLQTLLGTLRDGWVRSSPSDIGICGRADAMRARMHAIATLANAAEEEKSLETVAREVPALLK